MVAASHLGAKIYLRIYDGYHQRVGTGNHCWNRFRYDLYRSAGEILEVMMSCC